MGSKNRPKLQSVKTIHDIKHDPSKLKQITAAQQISEPINTREIGYLTDSKKVTITTIPRPME